ncbi:hypothetical protein ACR6HW_13670 [Fusibacter sp. JL298sf-3]
MTNMLKKGYLFVAGLVLVASCFSVVAVSTQGEEDVPRVFGSEQSVISAGEEDVPRVF